MQKDDAGKLDLVLVAEFVISKAYDMLRSTRLT